MKSSIETIEGFRAIGVPCVGIHQFGTLIPAAVRQLSDLLEHVPNHVNRQKHYGISPCSPDNNPDTKVYYIAVEVTDFTDIPAGVECLEVPSQKCAVVRKEQEQDVKDVYSEAFRFIKSRELQRIATDAPGVYQLEIFDESLEQYDSRLQGNADGLFTMDLCVPVR